MAIAKNAIRAYLGRTFNDYTWMKSLLRDQIVAELDSLKVKPRFKTEPWLHQLVAFYIGLCEPKFLYLLDMGTGKSKIISDLITHIQRERKLEGALIAVPRLINIDSWVDDLAVHSDLEPNSCHVSDTEEKWERLAYPKGDVTIIDYQGLILACCDKGQTKKRKITRLNWNEKKIKHLQRQYNFIAMDESHKLSSYDNLWFRVMDQLTSRMEFVYGATGTLFGKDPTDLWSQFYLVDGGETFGENLGLFRASFFTTKTMPFKGVTYIYNKAMHDKLHAMIQNKSLRYTEDEIGSDLAPRTARVQSFDMSDEQREHYLRAVEGLINANGKLSELDANWVRMRQIISGYLAWKDEHGDHVITFKQNPKMDGLERLIDEMGDSKIVICYDYTETGRLITAKLKALGIGHEWYYGGTKDQSASRRRFLDDPKCLVFVMNSEAGGTGNDGLQKVARYMVFYESPTPPTTRKQTVKRIHREGQTKRTFIYDLVMRRSLDKGILQAIQESTDIYTAVVNGKVTKKMLLGL